MSERLIDLHTDWLLQYAPETNLFGPDLYPTMPARLTQAEGYLGATSAAVFACYRNVLDWASRSDPWAALGELITRLEGEFCGRLLIGREDWDRWREDPDGLTWGVIGVEGFDALIRSAEDLARLPALFERGVRVFQPVYAPSSALAGSAAAGDDRGLTDLGREFLETLASFSRKSRPICDLAQLNPKSMADVLTWFEADSTRSQRVLLAYTHGAPAHEGFATARAISTDNLRRLRALGGTVGFGVTPPFFDSLETLKREIESAAAVPFRGSPGYAGLAIGTDFLGVDRVLEGLGNAPEVVDWLFRAFEPLAARKLVRENAEALIEAAIG